MATDDAPEPRRNPPFMARRDDDCEDETVREFMALAGWKVADNASAERHRLAWRFLLDQIEDAQKARGRRAAFVVILVSTVLSSAFGLWFPLIWKWLSAHIK